MTKSSTTGLKKSLSQSVVRKMLKPLFLSLRDTWPWE